MTPTFEAARWARTALLCVVAAASIVGCKRRGPPAARLSSAQGEVTLQQGSTQTAATPGAALYEGDVVSTGEKSSAAVSFAPSGLVSLGPSTTLVIKRTGTTATQIGAVLLRGSVRALSKGSGVRLTIGSPFGLAELGGDGDGEVSVSAKEGLKVLMGAIEVTTSDGKRQKLDAGSLITLEGLVIPAQAVVQLEPMDIVLVAANPAQVLVRHAGDDAWKAPPRRGAVVAGDSVRTRRATGTRITVGEHANVTLEPDTELQVLAPARDEKVDRGRYDLVSGVALFELERGGPRESVHEVKVGAQTVTVEAGLTAATVEVRASPNGQGQVTVRQGRALLASGAAVEPGSVVDIDRNGGTSVRALASTFVELRGGSNAVVRFAGDVPALRLTWDNVGGGPPWEVEVARDSQFKDSLWHDKLTRPAIATEDYRPGRYYWRVRTTSGWTPGSFALEPSRDTECRGCKRTNVIDDTGENTVVYFQKTLPAITLRWATVAAAATYHVKVFADGSFDKPLVDDTVAETTLGLPSGKLAEGKYFWIVQALGEGDKELVTGRINGLEIAYDNAVVDLEIRSPAHQARINAEQVMTTGEVYLGGRLSINGKPVVLDKKGRFRETLALRQGDNQLVYRTVGPDGVEQYHVRQVMRP